MSDIENKDKDMLLEMLEQKKKEVENNEVKALVFVTEYTDSEITTSWCCINLPGRLMIMAYTLVTDAIDNMMGCKYEINENWNSDDFMTQHYPNVDNRKKANITKIDKSGE